MQSLLLVTREFYFMMKLGKWKISLYEPFPKNIAKNYKDKGYQPYQPTYYWIFYKAIKDLKLLKCNPYTSSILDIGAGKGKVMRLAAQSGFKKVIGIEIEKKFYNEAVRCVNLLRNEYPDKEFLLLNSNAIDYFPIEKIDVVYLFNPFAKTALDQILRNFAFVNLKPRFLVYLNPVAGDVVESLGYYPKITHKTKLYIEYTIFENCD